MRRTDERAERQMDRMEESEGEKASIRKNKGDDLSASDSSTDLGPPWLGYALHVPKRAVVGDPPPHAMVDDPPHPPLGECGCR